jgi:alpha-beta hydrolase superfamily lysophospholipase
VWQLSLCSYWGDGVVLSRGNAQGQPNDLATGLGKEFASETATVNGIKLHYVRGGKGPAVILIHGFPQDWFEYRAIMPRLAKQFTVIAVDLRGIGGSTATADGYDAANMAEDIHQLISKIKLEHVSIEDQPERVADLIERYASAHSE